MNINENRPSTEAYTRNILLREYERGLAAEGTAGFHGTSVETIGFAIKNGFIPGSTALAALTDSIQAGDLFYFPPAAPDMATQLAADLAVYAHNIAKIHFILAALNLNKDNPAYYNAAADLTQLQPFHPELYGNARKVLGVSPQEAEVLEQQASMRKGVVVGIDESVFHEFDGLPGDPGEVDARIRTINGLPVKYVRGMLALGEEDARILKNIISGPSVNSSPT